MKYLRYVFYLGLLVLILLAMGVINDDWKTYAPGQNIVSPQVLKGFLISGRKILSAVLQISDGSSSGKGNNENWDSSSNTGLVNQQPPIVPSRALTQCAPACTPPV